MDDIELKQRCDELKRIYYDKTQATTDPKKHDEAYKEFLAEMYKLSGDCRIFQLLQMQPLQNAIGAFNDYLTEKITPREFYNRLSDKAADMYMGSLVRFGLAEDTDISGVVEEVIFEAIKGFDTLDKVPKMLDRSNPNNSEKERELISRQDEIGYMLWFNFIEKLHVFLGLPKVLQIHEYYNYCNEYAEASAAEVLWRNDFTKFKLLGGEAQRYRRHVADRNANSR